MTDNPMPFAVDDKSLKLFALKGFEESGIAPAYNNNGFKVRRVTQIIQDIAQKPFRNLEILDLACGEGVYAIECALKGAKVLAVDARDERMSLGREASDRIGLTNLRFEQQDIRRLSKDVQGQFDVILMLGILYHIDEPDVFSLLANMFEMCSDTLIIDTHISLVEHCEVTYAGKTYVGRKFREHGDEDSTQDRKVRLKASIDNTMSFWFTKQSLIQLLCDLGFTSVFECHAPLEAKPVDRITLVARKGSPTRIATYPWINERPQNEIEELIQCAINQKTASTTLARKAVEYVLMKSNLLLRRIGWEIHRL